MRTSLHDIAQIEAFLLKKMPEEGMLLFEANTIINKELMQKVNLQQQAYDVVEEYGRQQLRIEIDAIQRQLFTQPQYKSFIQKIVNIFSNR